MESGSPYGSITASPEDGLGPNVRPEKKEKSNNRYMNVAIAALTVAVVLICTASISTKSSGILRSSSEAASFAATKPTSEPKVTDEMKQDHDLKKGTEAKPNIVFVLVDDLGFDEINALSTTTPFLRTLASKSLTLTQYYTQETCTPARAALMTGRYPISSGLQYGIVTSTVEFGLDLEETLLPEVLKEQGNYKNYMIGKWNLGHYTPDYLPTARGFDYFLGYMDGQNNYWSKSYPTHDQYTDFMYADTDCYYKYDGDDMTTYSSALYAQKAVQVIKEHDYDANPLFLYYASQAVHDPFTDDKNFPGADEATYTSYSTWSDMIPEATFNAAIASSDVFIRQSYALSLAVLDVAVENIYKALTHVGQIENTYLVIASDNGGCFAAGAKNGDLRGTKGSLFEGGTKVNAYVYNPKITRTGMKYTGLTHVTDWFPTILSWAGINYRADSEEYKVDGLNQAAAMAGVEGAGTPREYMLYNAIVNVEGKNLDMKTNGPVAVRNSRYKLIHAYTSNPSATYYDESLSDTYDSDVSCPQSQSMAGDFQMMLFDLINDPNETTDLYGTPAVAEDQHLLYEHLFAINSNSKQAQSTYNSELTAVMAAWDASGSFVQPWRPSTSGPKKCENSDNIFSPSYSSRKK